MWAIKTSDKHYVHQSIVSGWHAFHNLYLILPGFTEHAAPEGLFSGAGKLKCRVKCPTARDFEGVEPVTWCGGFTPLSSSTSTMSSRPQNE